MSEGQRSASLNWIRGLLSMFNSWRGFIMTTGTAAFFNMAQESFFADVSLLHFLLSVKPAVATSFQSLESLNAVRLN